MTNEIDEDFEKYLAEDCEALTNDLYTKLLEQDSDAIDVDEGHVKNKINRVITTCMQTKLVQFNACFLDNGIKTAGIRIGMYMFGKYFMVWCYNSDGKSAKFLDATVHKIYCVYRGEKPIYFELDAEEPWIPIKSAAKVDYNVQSNK